MSETVIKVENVGKKYRIGANGAGTDGLRHVIHDLFAAPVRALRRNGGANDDSRPSTGETNGRPSTVGGRSEEFWALKDISFEVKRGEVVGIIGRNGAGKSTLLKILSRITEPTTGRLGIKGRVASLLEVGTGFHPELTGRENIFLNGAILGMSREEIKRKFDEIVAFAEIDKFIDTPVKRYSSGMYVRLAFAVAAHLEPEILIVDEVLAVGDAAFQKKCLGKMEQVGKTGRTVLFVSHNMTAVETLCSRVIRMADGVIAGEGATSEQVRAYLESLQNPEDVSVGTSAQIGPNLKLQRFDFSPNPIATGDRQEFQIEIASQEADLIRALVVLVYSARGQRVAILDLRTLGQLELQTNGSVRISGAIESLPLVDGNYHIGLYVESNKATGDFMYLSAVTVVGRGSTSGLVPYARRDRGLVELNFASRINAPSSVL